MSKGPGRIERAIEAAFRGARDGYFTVTELVKIAYPDDWARSPDDAGFRSQRVAVLRAARKVAVRLHWVMLRSGERGGEAVFANGLSLRSYGLGRVRAWLGHLGGYRWTSGPDGKFVQGSWVSSAERVIDRFETDKDIVQKVASGGDWWLEVERNTALARGDEARARELGDAIQRRHDAVTAQVKALTRLS